MKHGLTKITAQIICGFRMMGRSMRVRVSLDFDDILIESFISLCIIETVGAIFREYKPWIILLITQ
jgi:hypothetical protein